MKRLLLLILPLMPFLTGCSKDEDSSIDKNCGIVLQIRQQADGGMEELYLHSGCGKHFKDFVDHASTYDATIFYKGQTRPLATYLVVWTASAANKGYIRYESGNVPQETIDHYEDLGYQTDIQELTGLERANY